jgi:NADH:ubiquinone oxidoreductase subunit H
MDEPERTRPDERTRYHWKMIFTLALMIVAVGAYLLRWEYLPATEIGYSTALIRVSRITGKTQVKLLFRGGWVTVEPIKPDSATP